MKSFEQETYFQPNTGEGSLVVKLAAYNSIMINTIYHLEF